ncbi:MAG: hypothetical protein LBG27_01670 [Spirochaetaceae bacterium]|jgi:ABC-type sugar transport system permease subunit|nr:hypothetical protein [Spirochaetaceae bacterium]
MSQNNSLKQARERAVNITAAVCLAPAILFLVIFIAYPIVDSFVMSR